MISKKEKKIISQVSKNIKKAIKNLVEENDFLDTYIDPDNYCGSCAIASLAMYNRLREKGINCNWVYGYHKTQEPQYGERHCWVEYKGQIIDVTYKQISENSRNIYISPVKYVKLKQDPTHRVFNKYWKWQNPFKYNYYWDNETLEIDIKKRKES
jgi:hypothetical protein